MGERSCDIRDLHILLTGCLSKGAPLYAFQRPGSNRIEVGIQTNGEPLPYRHFSDLEGKDGFVFSPFDLEGKHRSWFIRKDNGFMSQKPLAGASLPKMEGHGQPEAAGFLQPRESARQEYFEQIGTVIQELGQRKLDKVVLSRIQLLQGGGSLKAVDSFLRLAKAYPLAFVFLVATPSAGTWVGASPETLVSATPDSVETVALAGTQKFGGGHSRDVAWTDKEIAEQAYVSDYIEKLLCRHQVGFVKKDGPNTVRAGNVVHLKTSFQSPSGLGFFRLSNLIHDLHPTPAVCGLPKDMAMELIRKVERHDREYYTGYLGPVGANGAISLYVNLRSMKVLQHQTALFVGGGITAGSDSEKEWEETCLKAQTLLEVIG